MTGKSRKVVIDTNLFVAAFWNRSSASARVIEACLEGTLVPVYTPKMRDELDTVLRSIRTPQSYKERVDALFEKAVRVEGRPASVVTEDPADQKFLECAVGAEAVFLITSDEHLLKLNRVNGTEIITPARFWREKR